MKTRTLIAVVLYGVVFLTAGVMVSATMHASGAPILLSGGVMLGYALVAVMAMTNRSMDD